MSASTQRIRVVFRYDDYTSTSPTSWEESLIDLFRPRGLTCAFGVVPMFEGRALGDTKIALLRRAIESGAVEPMLHGLCHRNARSFEAQGHPSELAGLDCRSQERLLEHGRGVLETALGAEIRLFAPPWNSYNAATVQALENLGFTLLSAGPRFGPSRKDGSLTYLPATCHLADLADAVEAARDSRDQDPWIVALFHAYDFREVDAKRSVLDMTQFAALLDWVTAQEDLAVAPMAQGVETADLGVERYRAHRALRRDRRWMPPFLRRFYRRLSSVYQSTARAQTYARRNLALIGFFYLAAAAAAGLAVRPFATSPIRLAIPFVGLAVLLFAGRRGRFTYKGATALAATIGALAGGFWPP